MFREIFLSSSFVILLIRNVIISGYLIPFYPSIDLFHVDWKMSKEIIFNNGKWMKSWVIIPFTNPDIVLKMPFYKMYKAWFNQQELIDRILICISFLIDIWKIYLSILITLIIFQIIHLQFFYLQFFL